MSNSSEGSRKKCRAFLAVADQYKLGGLPTEQPHPATRRLSSLSRTDLPSAVSLLKLVDTAAMTVLVEKEDEIERLSRDIHAVLESGGRIFLCGCGATGRLSLTLETLWREKTKGTSWQESVISFMAGGDLALIKSIENFEDFPAYAERQLTELDFREGDLLISCTEGGETPFVIGATERALELSSTNPYFLYCNPDAVLCERVERSRRVIDNPKIRKISLFCGPMAITGSTRMQASTVLMAAVGLGLFFHDTPFEAARRWMASLIRHWETEIDLSFLPSYIEREARAYEKGEYLLYTTDPDFGISVLTDTTERAPTFSLLPFENREEDNEREFSWCYLFFPGAENSRAAWRQLLLREPRTLEWPEIGSIASHQRLLGFDFSRQLPERRSERSPEAVHHHFRIFRNRSGIQLHLEDDREVTLPSTRFGSLGEHLLLKMILNIHSTLVMGRMDRYEGNVMTWVRASNNKLIDRSIRFVDLLLSRSDIHLGYEEIAQYLFEERETLPQDASLVLTVVNRILCEKGVA